MRHSDEEATGVPIIELEQHIYPQELFPIDLGINMNHNEDSLCASFMKSDQSLSYLKYAFEPSPVENPQITEMNEILCDECDHPPQISPIGSPQVLDPMFSLPSPAGSENSRKCSVKKQTKNRKFTKDEDERLRELVKKYGEGCWTKIAENMPGRNRKQVRERYVNFVKKERSLHEFTQEEDALILSFVATKGRKWIVISDMLPGRTPIMIKNRYYAKLRHLSKNVVLPNYKNATNQGPQNSEMGLKLRKLESSESCEGSESEKAGKVCREVVN